MVKGLELLTLLVVSNVCNTLIRRLSLSTWFVVFDYQPHPMKDNGVRRWTPSTCKDLAVCNVKTLEGILIWTRSLLLQVSLLHQTSVAVCSFLKANSFILMQGTCYCRCSYNPGSEYRNPEGSSAYMAQKRQGSVAFSSSCDSSACDACL